MENLMSFKEAVKQYRLDAGEHFTRPVRKTSHYSRGAWHLLDKRGGVVCIVGPDACQWGNKLAVYYAEMGRAIAG